MMPAAITTTFFNDRTATLKREESLSAEELARRVAEMVAAEKAKLPWLKLAVFGDARTDKNSLRHDANVLFVSGCEGDYDGEQISFEQAVATARAAGLLCIIYTSPSHRPAAPRWRVLCLFSRDLPPAERYRLVARLNGIFGGIFAPESFTLSQSYYYGRVVGAEEYKVELIEGTPIDLLDGLPEIGRSNGSAAVAVGSTVLQPDDDGGFHFYKRFPALFNERAIAAEITGGVRYHTACLSLLGYWATHDVPYLDALKRLTDLFEEVALDRRDKRWHARYADIPRCLADIYGKEAAKADATAAVKEQESEQPEQQTGNEENFSASDPPDPLTCTVQAWLDRELPEQDLLLGPFSTTTRAMLVAETGIGKTNIAIAMAFSMAAGKPFIHWYGYRRARVLFIDGEMSKRLLRARIRDAARRLGKGVPEMPEGLYFLCRDDFEMMPPLNTRAGQQVIKRFIETVGGVEFVVFDNVQALLLGDMKDEEPWQETLPWIRDLTRHSIGQLWVHHTGHDPSRSYGTKTREWQLDCVMIAESVERPDSDIAFALKFTKARERTPDNRHNYDPVIVTLNNDKWTAEGGKARSSKPPSPGGQKYYQALLNALANPNGSIVRVNGRPAVSMTAWKSECTRLRLLDPEDEANKQRADFSRYRRELIERDLIACQNELCWTVR